MIYLLDVNILIALVDPSHIHTPTARAWFEREGGHGWATCPITENGLLRIVCHPSYPNSLESPARVIESLAAMKSLPGHHFWMDSISLTDGILVEPSRLLTSAQITDSYLLALAVRHGGQLATFDRRLVTTAVKGGAVALHYVPDWLAAQ